MVIDQEKASLHALAEPLVDMFCQGDLPVWLDDLSGELSLLHPEPQVGLCLLSDTASAEHEFSQNIIEAADLWRTGIRRQN